MKITFKDGDARELSVEELKELLDKPLNKHLFQKPFISSDSSNKPSVDKLRANPSDKHKNLNPTKKEHKEAMPNNRKATLDQIRDIRKLAEEGKTNKQISEIVKISASNVNYWRKNTPKDLYV